MGIGIAIVFFIAVLQTLISGAMPQEFVNILVPSPNSPINISMPSATSSFQCKKNLDESYAVCASYNNYAVKYNLQPFSFAARGPNQGFYMLSCDLYETSSQSTSRAVCVKGSSGKNGVVYFHRVSDMINITNITIGITGNYPHVIVDSANEVAYVSNFNSPASIYKITNIGSITPIVAGNLTSFDSGDNFPATMLIIDGFLYVHFSMNPSSRLGRINISSFTWNQTVQITSGEYYGRYDNLANDDTFIYDLTKDGILTRFTYKNNNFARFSSLTTGLTSTWSLSISPDSSFLLLTADYSGILLVSISSFSVDSRSLLPHPASASYVQAFGGPIILSKNRSTNVYAVFSFTMNNDFIYNFNVSRVPFREEYPTIRSLPSSPIKTSSGVVASLQCTKNSDESYAVCASYSNTAIKYNLQPFALAAKGPNQGSNMYSCDLYETSSQSTSRAVCVKATYGKNGVVYFHRVSDMINITNITIGNTANYPHVIVDSANEVAYVSNNVIPSVIYKITSIGSYAPIVAGNLSSFGSNENSPVTMIIIDGFLYVHFYMNPARLARINISSFKWNQTVNFTSGESFGRFDNLANDDNFIYDLTGNGILVRCTYSNNNFTRLDRLITGLSSTFSFAISPDRRTLFVMGNQNSVLQMVDTTTFSKIGNPVMVPAAFGRPIVTSTQDVFAFSENSESVYAFRFNLTADRRTPSAELVAPRTASLSLQHKKAMSRSISASNDSTMTRARTAPSVSSSGVGSRSIEQSANTTSRSTSVTATRPQKPDLASRALTLATNIAQSIGIVAVAAVAAVAPSLGFGVARQQAMVNFMQNIRDGDCSGISDPNEVPAADSPTQMKIGTSDAKFYVGGAVGNTILSISLILAMQIVGTILLKYSGSSSWNRPFDVFARCNVALVGYVCASLLLAPTLTFGLVTVSVSNIENLNVGSKILAIIFSVVFAIPTFYYAIWSVLLRPNMELEQYRKLPKKNKEVSFMVRVLNFFFEGEGEWMLHKKANLKEKLNFDAATPMFEGYNGRAKWFGIVEFVVQVGLALAPFLANLVPVEKSCDSTFAVLIIVFGGYLLLCIWKRPFQELFNRIVIPLVTFCQIGVVILTYVYADNPPEFIVSLAMLTVSLQNAMIVIVLIASFSPLMKHALRAYRKLKRWWSQRNQQKLKSNHKHNNAYRVPSLRYLLGENDEELNLRDKNRRKDSKHHGESTKNKNYDDKIHHQQRTHRNSDMKTSRSMRVPSAEPQPSGKNKNNNNKPRTDKNPARDRKKFEEYENATKPKKTEKRSEEVGLSSKRKSSADQNKNNNNTFSDNRRKPHSQTRDSLGQSRK